MVSWGHSNSVMKPCTDHPGKDTVTEKHMGDQMSWRLINGHTHTHTHVTHLQILINSATLTV